MYHNVQFFTDDINYLLSMDKLWQTRRAPVPLDDQNLPVEGNTFNHLS